jgi:hypothetical protein
MTMMLMTIMTKNKRQEEKKTKMKKKGRKTCYHQYTGYIKATNDMETVISIDNRISKTANVYDEHLFWSKNKKKKREEQEMIF